MLVFLSLPPSSLSLPLPSLISFTIHHLSSSSAAVADRLGQRNLSSAIEKARVLLHSLKHLIAHSRRLRWWKDHGLIQIRSTVLCSN